jgi:hypothetical protein
MRRGRVKNGPPVVAAVAEEGVAAAIETAVNALVRAQS